MAKELDCRGLQCPEPVMRCRALIAEAGPAEFAAVVDNAAALENVQRFLARQGYAVSASQTGGSEWRISATRAGAAPCVEEAAPERAAGGKTVVLLTTETLGRGDDALGARLMETFLANLGELGDSLWRVILLNGAVKLSAAAGPALDSLKAIEAAGATVLVCGTCLGHYGLLEKKQVGETTNMMDVLTSLAMAQKVIRP